MSPNEKLDKGLDPEVAEYLKLVRSRPPVHFLSIDELRVDIVKATAHYKLEPLENIEDRNIQGPAGNVPIRIYTPKGEGPFPLVVFYHGGGWCIGSMDSHNSICASVANRTPAVVISVDYRLAPEHRFPAAVEDCFAALEYAQRNATTLNADPKRLVVMGDSAGGNLAAAVSLKSKREGGPEIAFQVLAYPSADISNLDIESCRLFGKGYDLDREEIEMFRSLYLPDENDWKNPYASPALAKDLRGLPPTLLITAEFDPLKDDGKAFADKLKRSGVPVKYYCCKGVIHGFLSFAAFHAAQKTLDEIADAIRGAGG